MSRPFTIPAALLAGVLIASGTASAKGPDPCLSSAVIIDQNGDPATGTGTWLACPQGDGPSFSQIPGLGTGEFRIRVECLDNTGLPIPFIPASDFWLVDCNATNGLILCQGSLSSNADASSDAEGITYFSGTSLAAGGCADELFPVAQGFALLDPEKGCLTTLCLPVNVRSPDMDADGQVGLTDLSLFAASFPPGSYDTCADFDGNGTVDLVDLSGFADHFGPPGHVCP